MSKKPERKLPLRDVQRALTFMLGLSLLSSVLLAGIALPAVGTLGILARLGTTSLTELPSEFKPAPASSRSVLMDTNGNEIAHFYAENRIVVDLKNMSPWLGKAAIATEDRRFYQHHGVDLEGMARALINNLLGRDTQGASTITQQYVKNTLIDKALREGDEDGVRKAREQSILRKLREAKDAIAVEKTLNKDQILEGYLNVAPYGRSVYGVESASQFYFSKPAKDLGIGEAALLVGITQSPANYDPSIHPDAAQNRRDQVLYRMLRERYITPDEYRQAKEQKVANMLKLNENNGQGCAAAGQSAYFCAYVVNEIYNSKSFGKTRLDRQRLLLRGGLKIKTTMDSRIQEAATNTAFAQIPENDPSGLSLAVTSIEPGTGKIRAIAQNTRYGLPTKDSPRITQTSFSVDRSHGGTNGFQPGSSFKMITLATFLDHYSANSYLGGKFKYEAKDWTVDSNKCKNMQASPWEFKNATGSGQGPTTVYEGTNKSLNSTYAAMAQKLDLCDIRATATKLGAIAGNDDSKKVYYPSYVIGISDVPPLNMANAYAAIAASGKYCKPIVLESVTDMSGKKLSVPPAQCEQAISAETANKTAAVLKGTYYSYGGNISIGRPAMTKTGTTNGPNAAWTVGATPNLATAVWVGYSEGHTRDLVRMTVNGRYYRILYGNTIPSATWREYMRQAVSDLPNVDFAGANPNAGEQIGAPPPPEPVEKVNPLDLLPDGWL